MVGGREAQEEGDVCILRTDSSYTPETSTILYSNVFQLKKKMLCSYQCGSSKNLNQDLSDGHHLLRRIQDWPPNRLNS